MVATGLLGALAAREALPEESSSVSEVSRAPAGTRLAVHGMVERMRPVGKGAVVSSLTDCAGNRTTVFFARGAGDASEFSLAVLVGIAQDYKGQRELVVETPSDARLQGLGAEMVGAEELRRAWRGHLCRPVAFTARIGWAAVSEEDPRDVDVGIPTASGELRVVVHLDAYPTLTVQPGATVSFVGILAVSGDQQHPVLHLRA